MTRRNKPACLRGLYAVTPDHLEDDRLMAQVQAILAGGCRIVQYRDKQSDAVTRLARARQLQTLCQAADAALIINDHLELALAIDADGIHLGSEDGDLNQARERLGPHRILGVSCYADASRARTAMAAGADYIAYGAVFNSSTKPEAVVAPLSLLSAEHPVPVCAIGGITLDNAPQVIAAGADMIAVITDLFSTPDLTTRTQAFQQLFNA